MLRTSYSLTQTKTAVCARIAGLEGRESQVLVVHDDVDDDAKQCNNDRRKADVEGSAGVPSGVDVRWWYDCVGVSRGAGSPCVKFVLRL